MIRLLGSVLLGLAVFGAGCAPSGTAIPEAESPAAPLPTAAGDRAPELPDVSLSFISGSRQLQIGDSLDIALALFPAPAGANEFSDLPARLQEPYQVRGWQTAEEGVGIATYRNRVALVMRLRDPANADAFDETRQTYERAFAGLPVKEFSFPKVRAAFWEENGVQLMILESRVSLTGPSLTVALGAQATMEALGMTFERVRREALAIEERSTVEQP